MLIRTLLSRTLVIISATVILSSCESKKTAYVDLYKLVNEFELQKEYSDEAKRDMNKEKTMVDSIIISEKIKNPANYENIRNELYAALYKKTEEKNKEIESMIWKRLNPYINDFGKEKGYSFIYGANGTGTMLYADEKYNITDELIKYVNQRYHGKN